MGSCMYVLLSGYRWMQMDVDGYDMPPKYGSFKTVWERHKKWSEVE